MSNFFPHHPDNRRDPTGCRFTVQRNASWSPFSYNPSLEDAIKMLKCQDRDPAVFTIYENGTKNRWDGTGKPLPA
jgi:hypothetical protein